jgi:hypothetical protein
MPSSAALEFALKLIAQIGLPAATGLIGFVAWVWERRQNIAATERHEAALNALRQENIALQAKVLDLAVAQIQVMTRVEAELAKLIITLNDRRDSAKRQQKG